jgi:hypothetical protein
MSPDPSVEEALTRTLRRAGELAVPDGAHVPFPIGIEAGARESGQWAPTSAVRRSTRPLLKVAMTGVAAAVLIAVGLAVLVGSSSPTRIQRVQLSALRGELLLCGEQGCPPSVHGSAAINSASAATSASPAYGADRRSPPPTPQDPWIVAADGRFVQAFTGSAAAAKSADHSVPGVIYLSAGAGRYYRYVTGQTGGPLRVVHHDARTVSLRGADGRSYVLNLPSAQLEAQR